MLTRLVDVGRDGPKQATGEVLVEQLTGLTHPAMVVEGTHRVQYRP
ncbi:MAG: hypothetical protein M3137_09675 [Actinomycetota bacterium]|nr:hypothetical protein [Actinomycetota bacterium]